MKKNLLLVIIALVLIALAVGGYFWYQNKDGSTSTSTTPQVVDNTGKKVHVRYVGKFEDGEVFDTNVLEESKNAGLYTEDLEKAGKYNPLEFIAGAGGMIPGFESAVRTMKVGDTRTVTLQPQEAYGEYDSGAIIKLPRSQFQEADIIPVVGETVNLGQATVKIIEVTDEEVTLDANSPMVGKTLVFTIKLEAIDNPQVQ